MKRTIIGTLVVGLVIGFVSIASGCASSGGPYFQKSRDHKAHVYRDRIYNPADYRYTE